MIFHCDKILPNDRICIVKSKCRDFLLSFLFHTLIIFNKSKILYSFNSTQQGEEVKVLLQKAEDKLKSKLENDDETNGKSSNSKKTGMIPRTLHEIFRSRCNNS